MNPARSTQVAASVASLFDPPTSGLGHVGVEIEPFPVRERNGVYEVVHHTELLDRLELDQGFGDEANVSFEPGGQLEIGPRPMESPRELLEALAGLLGRLDTLLAPSGVRLQANGVNRWVGCEAIGLRLTTERYRRMQAHFDVEWMECRAAVLKS